MAWERAIDDALAHILMQHPDNMTAYIFEMQRINTNWCRFIHAHC